MNDLEGEPSYLTSADGVGVPITKNPGSATIPQGHLKFSHKRFFDLESILSLVAFSFLLFNNPTRAQDTPICSRGDLDMTTDTFSFVSV